MGVILKCPTETSPAGVDGDFCLLLVRSPSPCDRQGRVPGVCVGLGRAKARVGDWRCDHK